LKAHSASAASCGAIKSFALKLAWQLDIVSSSECNRGPASNFFPSATVIG